LVQRKKKVVFKPHDIISDLWMYFHDDQVEVSSQESSFHEIFKSKDTWYLIDSKIPKKYNCIILLATSPHSEILKEFAKREGGISTKYMPPWDLDEIMLLNKLNYPDFSQEDVSQTFEYFGGIPRMIFGHVDPQQIEGILKMEDKLLKCLIYDLETSEPNDMSHKIMHLHVVEGSEYKKFKMKYATKLIAKKVFQTLQERKKKELELFLKYNHGSSLRGILFEFYVHDMLKKGGTLQIRQLSNPPSTTISTKYFQETEEIVFQKIEDVTNTNTDLNKYYRPVQKNFASIDSFVPPDTMIQSTVSLDHPVKHAGLDNFITQIRKSNKNVAPNLYFAVPDDIFQRFQSQPYHNANKKVLRQNECSESVRRVNQYVLEIPIPIPITDSR